MFGRELNILQVTHSARSRPLTTREAVTVVAAVALHCLSFSAAICRAYQPAMNAAKAMANSRSALVMLAYNTTAPARSCDFKP